MTARRRLVYVSSSYEYTVGIQPFTRLLAERGYDVHWVSFHRAERQFLRAQGIADDHVLDIPAVLVEPLSDDAIDTHLTRLEDGQVPLVRQLAGMDRLLREHSWARIRGYLARVERALTGFLSDRDIGTIISGRDSALQLCAAKVGGRLGIPFFVPTSYRWPNGWYGFCEGHTESTFVRFRQPSEQHHQSAAEFLAGFRREQPVAATNTFEALNNRLLARLPRDIRLFSQMARRRLADLDDTIAVYPVSRLFKLFLQRRTNVVRLAASSPYTERPSGRPYVLYAYHAQPESSIDVIAAPFADQSALIRQIAGAVPASHDFYVKLHPDRMGDLSPGKVKALQAIPGVQVLHPARVDGHQLRRGAAVVVTPAGTMAYEAALGGIPAIVFSDVFFTALPLVTRCREIEQLPDLIRAAITRRAEGVGDDADVLRVLADVLANGFSGQFNSYYGPISQPDLETMLDAYDQLTAWSGGGYVGRA